MPKWFFVISLALTAQANAATPRQVVTEIAASMDLVAQPTASCDSWAAAAQNLSYPALSDASEKYINTFSFSEKHSAGLDFMKSLFEMHTLTAGFRSTKAWIGSDTKIMRVYTSPKTKGYSYTVAFNEKPSDDNESLKTVDACFVVLANR